MCEQTCFVRRIPAIFEGHGPLTHPYPRALLSSAVMTCFVRHPRGLNPQRCRGRNAVGVRVSGGAASVVRALLGHVLLRRPGLRHVLFHALGHTAHRRRGGPQHDEEVGDSVKLGLAFFARRRVSTKTWCIGLPPSSFRRIVMICYTALEYF